MEATFEKSLSNLRDHEKIIALDICDSLESGGPASQDGRWTDQAHGDVLVRLRSGVFVVFKEKRMGPRSYLAVSAGRYEGMGGGGAVAELA
jgi:hypothetical protein